MAIISCPECGLQVSDKASTCIHCGVPLNQKSQLTVKLLDFGYKYDLFMKPFDLVGLFNQKGEKILSLRQGEVKTIPISHDMEVYAHHLNKKGEKVSFFGAGEKTASKPLQIRAGKTTKLQISIVKTTWANHITLSEVDYIDSE